MTGTTATGETAALLRGRRTTHAFKPELPPRELILQAIELARWAPNHRLTEPWRFHLLGRRTAGALADLNAELTAAKQDAAAAEAKRRRWLSVPGWLLVTCVKSADAVQAREDYAACACAVQNLMLYLWSRGVGTKWNTGKVTRDPRFFECVGVDGGREEVVSLLWYGYPAEVTETRRQPLEKILRERP
ncbi:MAG TPA: nitroreductase [Gammaproteobacteria bacterium]|nr:nitroreductase [Gammaproteobacteria bacterium]